MPLIIFLFNNNNHHHRLFRRSSHILKHRTINKNTKRKKMKYSLFTSEHNNNNSRYSAKPELCDHYCLSVILSVSRITHKRVYGSWSAMVRMDKGWPSMLLNFDVDPNPFTLPLTSRHRALCDILSFDRGRLRASPHNAAALAEFALSEWAHLL